MFKKGSDMIRVITYGTFDTLHYGHVRLLKSARDLGDHLTVALSTDEFNAIKNKKSRFTWEQRKKILKLFVTLMRLFMKTLGSKKLKIFKNII